MRLIGLCSACCLLLAVLGLAGCGTGLFGPTYRGYYIAKLTATPMVASPGEIVTIETEFVNDSDPNIDDICMPPLCYLETSAGALYATYEAASAGEIDPTTDWQHLEYWSRYAYLRAPDTPQDVTITATIGGDSQSISVEVR